MEESFISWPFLRPTVFSLSSYRWVACFLFLFVLVFTIHVQPAPGADPEKRDSGNAKSKRLQLAKHYSTTMNIKPVRKNKSDRFNSIIEKACERYNVEPALIKAIIMAESAYNPRAVSKQGAKGLMQLMPNTARALGVKNVFNPAHNIHGGAKYLRQLLDAFNHNVKLALAAYNAGVTKVRRHQGVPPIKATRNYIKKVFAYYHHYKSETSGETEKV